MGLDCLFVRLKVDLVLLLENLATATIRLPNHHVYIALEPSFASLLLIDIEGLIGLWLT